MRTVLRISDIVYIQLYSHRFLCNLALNFQNLKRNQPQRNDQLYPREIPPRFQRRMKQQQQQSVFPQQPSQPVSQPTSTAQQQTVALGQPPQTKAISKPIPAGIEIQCFLPKLFTN